MSDPANSRPETAAERASALLADAARAAHGRISGAGVSLAFLLQPEHHRLSEVERITIRRLLKTLVETIEAELRARLLARSDLPDAPAFIASLGAPHVAIAWPMLVRAGLPEDEALAELLIHRARTYGITRNLRQNAVVTENSRLEALAAHGDKGIAADAMKLLIVESRINDRFDDPRLSRSDLSEMSERRLIWTVAAALRDYGEHAHALAPQTLDHAIAEVATAMLTEPQEESAAEVVAMELAHKLDKAGILDERLLMETLNAGRFVLYVAMLAVHAGTAYSVAWEMAVMPHAPSHMILLKSIGTERTAASHLLVAMARALISDDREADEIAAAWMEAFDLATEDDIDETMRPWRLDPVYRTALSHFAAAGETGLS